MNYVVKQHAITRYRERFGLQDSVPNSTAVKGILRCVECGVKIGQRKDAEYIYFKGKIVVVVGDCIVTVHKPDEPYMWAMMRDTLKKSS